MIREIIATARVYLVAVSVFAAMFNIALARFLSNSRSTISRNVSEQQYGPSEQFSESSKQRLWRKKFFIVEYFINKYKYRRNIKNKATTFLYTHTIRPTRQPVACCRVFCCTVALQYGHGAAMKKTPYLLKIPMQEFSVSTPYLNYSFDNINSIYNIHLDNITSP